MNVMAANTRCLIVETGLGSLVRNTENSGASISSSSAFNLTSLLSDTSCIFCALAPIAIVFQASERNVAHLIYY